MIEKADLSDKAINQIVEVVRPILKEKDKEIERLKEENNLLKQIIGNDKKYSYGIRTGSDKE